MQAAIIFKKSLFGLLMINGDQRERIVVDAQNVLTSKPSRRNNGLGHTHRKIPPQAKSGKLQRGRAFDQLDIVIQGRVAAVLKGSLPGLHEKPSRLASIGSVRHAAGMDGRRKGDLAEVKVPGSAGVHGMNFF